MSANNQLLIKKTKQGYIVKDVCVEGGTGEIIFVAQNLETAIKKATWERSCGTPGESTTGPTR